MDDPASRALCWNSAVLNAALEYATHLACLSRTAFSLKSLFLPCPCLLKHTVCNVSKMKSVLAINTDNNFSKLIITLKAILSLAMTDPNLAWSDPF